MWGPTRSATRLTVTSTLIWIPSHAAIRNHGLMKRVNGTLTFPRQGRCSRIALGGYVPRCPPSRSRGNRVNVSRPNEAMVFRQPSPDGELIVGSTGDDVLVGTGGWDIIVGGRGNDTLNGGGGLDYICGGRGWDVLRGGEGDDFLYGGVGRDKLYGDEEDQQLWGNGAAQASPSNRFWDDGQVDCSTTEALASSVRMTSLAIACTPTCSSRNPDGTIQRPSARDPVSLLADSTTVHGCPPISFAWESFRGHDVNVVKRRLGWHTSA
jgi:hypothetical protein